MFLKLSLNKNFLNKKTITRLPIAIEAIPKTAKKTKIMIEIIKIFWYLDFFDVKSRDIAGLF